MDFLLPIGSVIRINSKPFKLLIVGYLYEENNKVYKYYGAKYPEGLASKERVCFNSEVIDKIFFVGAQNLDFLAYRKMVEEYYEKAKNGKNSEEIFMDFINEYKIFTKEELEKLVKECNEENAIEDSEKKENKGDEINE